MEKEKKLPEPKNLHELRSTWHLQGTPSGSSKAPLTGPGGQGEERKEYGEGENVARA